MLGFDWWNASDRLVDEMRRQLIVIPGASVVERMAGEAAIRSITF
ncbi:hypothetical protein [Novosphingobium sp. BL-52-GroH]